MLFCAFLMYLLLIQDKKKKNLEDIADSKHREKFQDLTIETKLQGPWRWEKKVNR